MSLLPPEPLYVIHDDMVHIHCLLFHIDKNKEYLYAGTGNGLIHIWDLKTNRKINTFKSSENACLFLYIQNGILISQDKTCSLKIWQIDGNEYTVMYSKQFKNFSYCKISIYNTNTNIYAAIPLNESKIELYLMKLADSVNMKLLHRFEYTNNTNSKLGDVSIVYLAYVVSILCIFSLYECGSVILWDIESKNMIFYHKITDQTPMTFDFDSVNMKGVCGTSGNELIFFKMNNDRSIGVKKLIPITNPGVGSLKIRPDSKILVAGCWDGKLRIFSWKTCKLLAVLECHQETILSVSFSHSTVSTWSANYLLAAGSNDKKISLWSVYN